MGATHSNFTPPASLTSGTASTDLLKAVNALLLAYGKSGVPSEHTSDPYALAFQKQWNQEPDVIAVGGNAILDQDGAYGPNTQDAVAAVNDGMAPVPNTAAAPSTTPASPAIVKPVPSAASTSSTGKVLLLVGGAAFVLWLLLRKKKPSRAHPMLEVRTNPFRPKRGKHNLASRALR